MSYVSFISSRSLEHEEAARKKAEGRTKESAQNRMYNLMLERDRIEQVIKELDNQNQTLIEEGRGLLELYPTLAFRETRPPHESKEPDWPSALNDPGLRQQ